MKFDTIYNEALLNTDSVGGVQPQQQTQNNTTTINTNNKKINPSVIDSLKKKFDSNSSITLSDEERAALSALFGSDTDTNTNTQQQQTTTPPVIANPAPTNKPQVKPNTPAI